MASTYYRTVNGRLRSQTTGGVATGYATDALGSVVATVDNAGTVANTYRYKPYGAILAKTGTSSDPKNQWVGSYGYRSTGRAQSESYVRARHYGQTAGMWTTVDPLWPTAPAFTYSGGNPSLRVDTSGLSSTCLMQNPPNQENECSKLKGVKGACIALLCSMGSVREMVDDLKGGSGLDGKDLKKLYEWVKGMWGKSYSPKECCKRAVGSPRGPVPRMRFGWPPVEYVPSEMAWIIKQACAWISGPNFDGICFFVCRSHNEQECHTYCERWDEGTKFRYRCDDACEKAIFPGEGSYKDPGNGGVWSSYCQCGAKRGAP